MRSKSTMRMLSRGLGAVLLAGCAAAHAAAGCGSMITHNYTPKWVWITIYDAGKLRHLDWGWVAPFTDREWRSGGYSCAGIYHVRGEAKSGEDPSHADGGTIFDTSIEVGWGDPHDVYMKTPVQTELEGAATSEWSYNPTTFWWDHSPNMPTPTESVPRISWNLVNNASVTTVFQSTGLRGQKITQCLAPNGKALLTVPYKLPRWIYITAKTGDCNSPDLGGALQLGPPLQTSMQYFMAQMHVVDNISNPKPALTYFNAATTPVQFSSPAGTRCIATNQRVVLPVSPGTYRVTARVMRDCTSGQGYGSTSTDATVKNHEVIAQFDHELVH